MIGYTIVSNDLLFLDIKPTSRLVLILLTSFKNCAKGIFPSIKYISEKLHLSDRTVKDSIKELKEHKLIEVAYKNGLSNTYKLNQTKADSTHVTQVDSTQVPRQILPTTINKKNNISLNVSSDLDLSARVREPYIKKEEERVKEEPKIRTQIASQKEENRVDSTNMPRETISVSKERYMILQMIKDVTYDSNNQKTTKFLPESYVSHLSYEVHEVHEIVSYMNKNGLKLHEYAVMDSPKYVRNRFYRIRQQMLGLKDDFFTANSAVLNSTLSRRTFY